MQVWVVSAGEYSDCRAVAVFTNEVQARQYAAECDGFAEKHETDVARVKDTSMVPYWHCRFTREGVSQVIQVKDPPEERQANDGSWWLFSVQAATEERAIRLAVEKNQKRAALLAGV